MIPELTADRQHYILYNIDHALLARENVSSHLLSVVARDRNKFMQKKTNLNFADTKQWKMINKNYFSICFVTFTLSMFLFYWSKHFSIIEIETNDWQESSMAKYEIFISRLKQSGISNVDCSFIISPLSILETDRVREILDLKLSDGEITISNQEAKILFFKTLALPLQSVCK